MAGGTESAGKNILLAKTGIFQLRTIGFAQIEMDVLGGRLVARRAHIKPLQWIWFFAGKWLIKIFGAIRKLRSEFCDQIGADFVAAGPD